MRTWPPRILTTSALLPKASEMLTEGSLSRRLPCFSRARRSRDQAARSRPEFKQQRPMPCEPCTMRDESRHRRSARHQSLRRYAWTSPSSAPEHGPWHRDARPRRRSLRHPAGHRDRQGAGAGRRADGRRRAGQVGDPLAGDIVVLAIWYAAVDDVSAATATSSTARSSSTSPTRSTSTPSSRSSSRQARPPRRSPPGPRREGRQGLQHDVRRNPPRR